MTASKYIKAQGLPSTVYVADKVGKPPQTINNWYHNNYALFKVVVAGCVRNEQHYTYYYDWGKARGIEDFYKGVKYDHRNGMIDPWGDQNIVKQYRDGYLSGYKIGEE